MWACLLIFILVLCVDVFQIIYRYGQRKKCMAFFFAILAKLFCAKKIKNSNKQFSNFLYPPPPPPQLGELKDMGKFCLAGLIKYNQMSCK
jgi:hypothetical protein